MGEAWGGDPRGVDTGHIEHTQLPYRTDPAGSALPAQGTAETEGQEPEGRDPESRDGKGPDGKGRAGRNRDGKLDLNVPQVAGSAVAAVVAAKLASNLGVYGTIAGAGVVSVLGTCGGSILQHFFRRTGRHMQEVAVQARPGVRRVRDGVRERTLTRTDMEAQPGPTALLSAPGPAATRHLTTAVAFTDPTDPTDPTEGDGPNGYSEPTSYRARSRGGWKRPALAVALAFGLTMAGITGYEAVAGENISGHGHGTTLGNAVTGHSSSHSGGTGHTPSSGTTGTPSPGTTSPHRSDTSGRPRPDTSPSASQPAGTPSTGTNIGTGTNTGSAGSTSGGTHPTETPTSPPPASASPSPTATPSGDAVAGGSTDSGFSR